MKRAKVLVAGALLLTSCLSAPIAAAQSDVDFGARESIVPLSGRSIHLASFNGNVYYTVEPEGYRVVVTLAAGPEALPIRLIATLASGQRMAISVPQSANQPALELEMLRSGDALFASQPVAAAAELVGTLAPQAALGE